MNISCIWQTINCDSDERQDVIIDRLQNLIDSGCENVRINLKDFSQRDIFRVDKLLNAMNAIQGKKPGIMLDIPYPRKKCRIHMKHDFQVMKNDIVEMFDLTEEKDENEILINMKLFKKTAKNQKRYYIGDGEGILELSELSNYNSAIFRAIDDFVICCNKAISVEELFYKELDEWCSEILKKWISFYNNINSIALSFVEEESDINCLNKIINFLETNRLKIYAKIENEKGANNVKNILQAFHGCIIARGDLALNSPITEFLTLQNRISEETNKQGKDLFYATDILSSLAYQNFPSRGELVDYIYLKNKNPQGIILKSSTYFKKRFSCVDSFISEC